MMNINSTLLSRLGKTIMFKYFQTPDNKSVAINPLHVMSITEYQMGKAYPTLVILSLTDGSKVTITNNYLDVVAELSSI